MKETTSFDNGVKLTFDCTSLLYLSLKIPDSNPFEIFGNADQYFSKFSGNATEGELFYNSDTNRLQKFVSGEWTDISGVGGPPSPRR